MKNLWLLPDNQQSGEIEVLGGVEEISISKSADIPLRQLPNSFVLGIPESVLKDHPDEAFIYSQYARLPSGKSAFACSMRAGRDKTGRTVYLTNLQILNKNESPNVPPDLNENSDDKEIVGYMNRMRILFEDKKISANTEKMLEAVRVKEYINSFASEHPGVSASKPGWWPAKAKKKLYAIIVLAVSVALAFLIKYSLDAP